MACRKFGADSVCVDLECLLKEGPRGLDEEGCSGYTARFEARGKEFISVARIIKGSAAKANLPQPRKR